MPCMVEAGTTAAARTGSSPPGKTRLAQHAQHGAPSKVHRAQHTASGTARVRALQCRIIPGAVHAQVNTVDSTVDTNYSGVCIGSIGEDDGRPAVARPAQATHDDDRHAMDAAAAPRRDTPAHRSPLRKDAL